MTPIEHRPGCPAMRVETFTATRPGAIVERVGTHDAGDPLRPGQSMADASGLPVRIAVGAFDRQEPDIALIVTRCIDCAEQTITPAP